MKKIMMMAAAVAMTAMTILDYYLLNKTTKL